MKNAIVLFVDKTTLRDFWVTYMSLIKYAVSNREYDLVVCVEGLENAIVDCIAAAGREMSVRVINASVDNACLKLRQGNPDVPFDDVLRYGMAAILRDYDLAFQVEPGVVFLKDISSVFLTSLNGHYLAAIQDFYGTRSRPTAMRRYGVPNHPFFFDDTVMLFDLVRMRKLHMWKKMLSAHSTSGCGIDRKIIYNQVLGANVAVLSAAFAYPCVLDFEQPQHYIEGIYAIDLDPDIVKRYSSMFGLSLKRMNIENAGGVLSALYADILKAIPDGGGVDKEINTVPAGLSCEPVGGFPLPSIARVKRYLDEGDYGCRQEPSGIEVVVSLTTIPARIDVVALTIFQLLHQTYKPDRVCLWLAREQFPGGDNALPGILKGLCSKGLQICWADENLGPHTKYYYAMQANPDSIVITVDDDVVYPLDLVESLMNSYLRNPKAVSARRAHLIRFTEQGGLQPYKSWNFEVDTLLDEPLHSLCATGVGGVLYPPRLLPAETFNREAIKELALKADDIWLKIMEVKNDIPVVVPERKYQLEFFADTQAVGLLHGNVAGGGNDTAISSLLRRYNVEDGRKESLVSRMLRDQQFVVPARPATVSVPKKADIEVCFICDNGYIVPTTVAITSLLQSKFRRTVCHIYIVAADLSRENEDHFKRFAASDVAVTVIRSSARDLEALHVYNKKAMCVASPAALLKFFLGEMLPHLDKVLYLDGDLLVRRDLSSLYGINLGSNLVAAVPDSGKMYSRRPILHAVKSYFNSGVMLLNLKAMRDERLGETLLEAKRKSTDASLMDQNIFNQVFDGRVHALPIRYNCLFSNLVRAFADGHRFSFSTLNAMYHTHYRNFVDLKNDAAIIHFASKEKPWKYVKIPLIDEWDSVFRMSLVKTVKLSRQAAVGPLSLFNANRWFDEELSSAKFEIDALKASEAYRVGMFVTWPARKAWRGVKCLRENGMKYTAKHIVGKALRAVGSKCSW